MPAVTHTKFVKKGDWRTLESGWNAKYGCLFRLPQGAKVKLRSGIGWFGTDSQQRTLDGAVDKSVQASGIRSRIQMKVLQDVTVSYIYSPLGPEL